MKSKIIALLLFTLLSPLAAADNASHRQAAADILDLISGPELFRAGFQAMLKPMLSGMRENGATEAQVREIEAAFNDWLEKEIKWDELKPQMLELYVREFSEPELRDILAFYKSPTGLKALKRLPALMAEGAKIGEKYAQTKQAGLEARIKKALEKNAP